MQFCTTEEPSPVFIICLGPQIVRKISVNRLLEGPIRSMLNFHCVGWNYDAPASPQPTAPQQRAAYTHSLPLTTTTMSTTETTSNTATLAYPEAAHTALASSSINTQPKPISAMSVTDPAVDNQQGAMRLRGGCIPCPVSATAF